jgi:hypothetical protein
VDLIVRTPSFSIVAVEMDKQREMGSVELLIVMSRPGPSFSFSFSFSIVAVEMDKQREMGSVDLLIVMSRPGPAL